MENDEFTIEEFTSEYLDELERLKIDAETHATACFSGSNCPYPDDFVSGISAAINDLRTLSMLKDKIGRIKNIRKQCRLDLYQLKINEEKNLAEALGEFDDTLDKIISLYKEQDKDAYMKAKEVFEEIDKCPFGERDYYRSDAKRFENAVLEFFEWIFINELKRMDLTEIEDQSMKRDGGFEVTAEFDTRVRCKFAFNHIFIECKNYKKPTWRDLVQTYAYTLYCKNSEIFNIPLSILVSRENPGSDSATWKMRSLLYSRKIDQEFRLILFLDSNDLGKMLDYRKNNGDPAVCFREKAEELWKSDLKHSFD